MTDELATWQRAFGAVLEEFQRETGRRVLVICATGSRSSVAAKQLAQAGYDVLNVNGGVMGWMRQGLPLKTKGR